MSHRRFALSINIDAPIAWESLCVQKRRSQRAGKLRLEGVKQTVRRATHQSDRRPWEFLAMETVTSRVNKFAAQHLMSLTRPYRWVGPMFVKAALCSLRWFYGTKDWKRQSRKSGPSYRCSHSDLASQFHQSRHSIRLYNPPDGQKMGRALCGRVHPPVVPVVSIPNILS